MDKERLPSAETQQSKEHTWAVLKRLEKIVKWLSGKFGRHS